MEKRGLLITILVTAVVLFGPGQVQAYPGRANSHLKFGFEQKNSPDSADCLRCHDINMATRDYALIWKNSVTNLCVTCHNVYQAAPIVASSPDHPRAAIGTASGKSVYKVPPGDKLLHEGHRLGLGLGGDDRIAAIEAGSTELVPGSSYPGIEAYEYLRRGYMWKNFIAGQDISGFLASGRNSFAGLFCGSCHSPHGDLGNTVLPGKLSNNKLLLSRPNYKTESLDTVGWNDWLIDGYRFCAGCHENHADETAPPGVRNHPSEFCLQCHGDGPAYADFPHTGTPALVSDDPDQLCVATCHAFNLP